MHPGNIFVLIDGPGATALRGGGLRHRRHARPARPALSGGELPRGVRPRLPARGRSCTWSPAGCRPARGWTRWNPRCAPCCEPIFDRPLQGHLLRAHPAAAVRDLAALQHADPAAAHPAAEDAAERRGPGTRPVPASSTSGTPRARSCASGCASAPASAPWCSSLRAQAPELIERGAQPAAVAASACSARRSRSRAAALAARRAAPTAAADGAAARRRHPRRRCCSLGGCVWLALQRGHPWLGWALLAAGVAKLVYGFRTQR